MKVAEPTPEERRTSTTVDAAAVAEFKRLLDPDAKWMTLQTFTDLESKPTPDPLAKVHNVCRITQVVLDAYRAGAGVWITVNDTEGNGRKKTDVTRVRAVWQEDDDGFEGEFPLEPSIVVESSPGRYHRYWLVEGPWPADADGRAQFAGVMERMIASYGSDPGAKDISRVLRLPGFQHRKDPDTPHMVRIVGGNRGRYPRAQIMEAYPPPKQEQRKNGNGHEAGPGSESYAELVRQVITGEHYHPALLSLSWRMMGAGVPAGMIVENLRGLMLSRPESERDERWQARFNQIPGLVDTAGKKQDERPDEWPDPVSLPSGLLPVAPFDYAMLPDRLQARVEDITERMQCPADYVGVSMMTGLGSVIGRKVGVRPKLQDDWTEVGTCGGSPSAPLACSRLQR